MNAFIKNNSLLAINKCIICPIGSNSANYYRKANWNGSESVSLYANLTTVGTNGGSSAYGTYDQSGNVEEWLENYSGTANGIIYMNRHTASFDDADASAVNYLRYDIGLNDSDINTISAVSRGFRVGSLENINAYNNYVTICNPNNTAASNGYGAVPYTFLMNKYLVTNNDYMQYLVAIATTDGPTTNVFTNTMETDLRGGINRTQTGGSGASSTWSYNIRSNMGNKPVNFVSWKMAARYVNWLHNGKPNGAQNSGSTEDGAYDMALSIPTRKIDAKYFLPTVNEWTKAGFYKGGSTNAGYWLYATQSNLAPTPVYATSIGDGIIPSIVLGNLNNNYSKTSTTVVSVSNAALGFNTNNDSKLKVSAIVLRSPTLPTSVNIYSNSGGVPGSILFSSSGYASLGNGYYRYYFNNATLSSSSIYWVVPGVNWGLTTENGNLSNINNTPIAMNNSSYSFVDVLQQVYGVWSSYSTPNSYSRNLVFSLECYL